MAYNKNLWKDQIVERPRTYTMVTNDDETVTLIDSFGEITEAGTPVNAEYMNHIENGIESVENSIDSKIEEILKLIYPVGALYIGVTSYCPIGALFGSWELVASDRVLQGSSETNKADTTIEAGLPNHEHSNIILNGSNADLGTSGTLVVTANSESNGTHTIRNSKTGKVLNNSIYRDDVTTVQPPAYVVNIWKRVS